MTQVTVKRLWKEFGAQVVLENVNLHIGDHEFVTIVGASGCGKTTTLRLLAGLEDVNAGAVCRFQNARYDVALIGVEGFVSSHFLGELSPVRIDLCGKNHRAAARACHGDRH